jgi:hypothetical protein
MWSAYFSHADPIDLAVEMIVYHVDQACVACVLYGFGLIYLHRFLAGLFFLSSILIIRSTLKFAKKNWQKFLKAGLVY